MTSASREPEFVLSVFDRLYDDDPDEATESRPCWVGPREVVKASVLLNIARVLNARRFVGELPGGTPHLERSVLAYGMPDFSGLTMASPDDRERLRAAIESAVRRFEPRLTGVKVSPPDVTSGGVDLRFRIDAVLSLRPVLEPVTFDSVLLLSVRSFEVRG